MVRRGFTLAELMVGIIVAGLVGTALMGMLLTEAKATSNRDAWRNARGVSRGTLNLLESELAMVETTGGIETVEQRHGPHAARPLRHGDPLRLHESRSRR